MEYLGIQIIVTVPVSGTEYIRNAICEEGAEGSGNYTHCSMATKCVGTFKSNEKANPYFEKINHLEFAEEDKLEVVCDYKNVKKVLAKLRDVHPYEEPVIDIVPLLDEEIFDYI